MFITIEGIDGSGKTSIMKPLKEYIEQKGYDVFLTREPGGTLIAEEIRNLVLRNRDEKMDSWTEALLFIAARRQHLSDAIIPALKEKKVVLCDRFMDSTSAYQGAGRDLKVSEIDEIQGIVLGQYQPDATIYLKVDLSIANQRMNSRDSEKQKNNRLDNEKDIYKQKVLRGYADLITKYPNRFYVFDANLSEGEVINQAKEALDLIFKYDKK